MNKLAEIEVEVLRFFSRDMLDAYQLVSKATNVLVAKNASALALRRISKVSIVSNSSLTTGSPCPMQTSVFRFFRLFRINLPDDIGCQKFYRHARKDTSVPTSSRRESPFSSLFFYFSLSNNPFYVVLQTDR